MFTTVFHGFSATVSSAQATYLLQHPSVLTFLEDHRRELHTTRSSQFLGLRNQCELWSESDYGFDVIIGVFDTAIWPERQSFSDHNLGDVSSWWKRVCQIGDKFTSNNGGSITSVMCCQHRTIENVFHLRPLSSC
ncbi:hypothetical protein U1Q18_017649 [Sarracenia purpurea var. burkii]